MTPFDFNTASPEEVRAEADRRQRAKGAWETSEDLNPAMQRRKEMLLERDVQQRVIRLYVRYGCKVRVFSQPRKAKYLTPGQADLQVLSPMMAPRSLCNQHPRIMWYHETKKPIDGRYSDDQLLFAADMREAGIDVIGGGTDEAQYQLDRLNIPVPE